MKKVLALFILALVIVSCKTTKDVYVRPSKQYETLIKKGDGYAIYNSALISEQDTFYTEELRIFEIRSSMDGIVMMYQDYGQWSEKLSGRYQDNINRYIWQDIDLLGDGERYTVIADGTETMTEYFVSLIIIDQSDKNCLAIDHPQMSTILNFVVDKMKTLETQQETYTIIR